MFPDNSLRTGSLNTVGLEQIFTYKNFRASIFGVGEFDDAKADYWSYDGFWAGLRLGYNVWDLSFAAEGAYGQKRYRGVYPGTGVPPISGTRRFDPTPGIHCVGYLRDQQVGGHYRGQRDHPGRFESGAFLLYTQRNKPLRDGEHTMKRRDAILIVICLAGFFLGGSWCRALPAKTRVKFWP